MVCGMTAVQCWELRTWRTEALSLLYLQQTSKKVLVSRT
jgi:hypothetical protein